MRTIILGNSSDIDGGPWNKRQLREFLKKLSPLLPKKLHITINHIDDTNMQEINKRFRKIDKTTNILSFNYETSDIFVSGELLLSLNKIHQEAADLNITVDQHYAHLIIHGILHLLGYDHETDDEAKEMESLETLWLTTLGYQEPYPI